MEVVCFLFISRLPRPVAFRNSYGTTDLPAQAWEREYIQPLHLEEFLGDGTLDGNHIRRAAFRATVVDACVSPDAVEQSRQENEAPKDQFG